MHVSPHITDDLLHAFLDAAGISWPDIDDQAVWSLGDDFEAFGGSLMRFGSSIGGALKTLEEVNRSSALDQLRKHWYTIDRDYLIPAQQVCDDLMTGCMRASTLIYGYKQGLKMKLTIEAGTTAMAVAAAAAASAEVGGVGGAAAAAAGYALARRIAEEAGEQILLDLGSQVFEQLESDVKVKLKGLVHTAATKLGDEVYASVVSGSTPGSLTGRQRELVIDAVSLDNATLAIKASTSDLIHAANTLRAKIKSKDLRQATPLVPDSTLRVALKSTVNCVVDELIVQAERLGERLIEHTTGLVGLFDDSLRDADRHLAGDAKSLPTPTSVTTPKIHNAQDLVHLKDPGAPLGP